MTLLAIDPGRAVKASIGYAVFDTYRDGELWENGSLTWDELCLGFRIGDRYGAATFQGIEITEVVIENFVNNTRSRGGQTNGTSEVIGAVEYVCFRSSVQFTRQPNTILPVAKLQAGYVDHLKHLPHQDAAYLHGYYYLVGKGVLEEKGLRSTIAAEPPEPVS